MRKFPRITRLWPWLFLGIAFLCLPGCEKREGGIKGRTNPVDMNGDSLPTVNIPPLVKVNVLAVAGKATWDAFNFQDSTGSVIMSLSGFDSNGVTDTLRYSLYFGSSPAALSLVKSSGLDSFFMASHLRYSTRYYYRCVVHDKQDTAVDTGSFLTAGSYPPFAPTGLSVWDEQSAIMVSWNTVYGSDGYCIYRAESPNGWYSKIATLQATTTFYDSVAAYTMYYYRVSSYNTTGENRCPDFAAGRKYFSTVQIFTPVASQGDSLVGANRIGITLTFRGGSTGTYPCHLYRSTSMYGNYIDVQTISANTNSNPSGIFIDTVPDASTYYYKIATFDGQGRGSSLSDYTSGWTKRLGMTYLRASNETYGPYVDLSWDVVPGATGYYIYRSATAHTTLDTTYRAIDTTNLTQYKDSVLSDKLTYSYIIVAFNSEGAGQQSTMQYGKRMPPPSGFKVDKSYTTTEYIYLTWTSSYSNPYYYLYRSTDKKTFVCIDTLTSAYYQDTTVKDYSLYYYVVSSVNNTVFSESAKSPLDSGRLKPLEPDSLTAAQAKNKIIVGWNHVNGALGYHFYRYNQINYTWRAIDTTSDTISTDSVISDSVYQYRVAAYNESGEGSQSQSIYQKRLSPPSASHSFTVTGGPAGITLEWIPDHSQYSSPAKGFYIYRTEDSTRYPFTVIDTVSDSLITDTVTDAKVYLYKVAGYNDAGEGKFAAPYGAISAQRTKPEEPDSLKASLGDFTNSIRVQWGRCDGASGYRVYRFTKYSPPDSFKLVATTVDTQCFDPVYDDSMYFYRIVSYSVIGSSSLLLGQNYIGGFQRPSIVPLPPALSSISQTSTFTIYWSAPDSGARFNGYHLYRAVNDSVNGFSLYATVNTTQYRDTNVPLTYPPDAYYYKVRTYNAVGESVDSNVKRAVH